jgi:hypothetical protein
VVQIINQGNIVVACSGGCTKQQKLNESSRSITASNATIHTKKRKRSVPPQASREDFIQQKSIRKWTEAVELIALLDIRTWIYISATHSGSLI